MFQSPPTRRGLTGMFSQIQPVLEILWISQLVPFPAFSLWVPKRGCPMNYPMGNKTYLSLSILSPKKTIPIHWHIFYFWYHFAICLMNPNKSVTFPVDSPIVGHFQLGTCLNHRLSKSTCMYLVCSHHWYTVIHAELYQSMVGYFTIKLHKPFGQIPDPQCMPRSGIDHRPFTHLSVHQMKS